MINREQIESILKVNGVSPAAPDEQIRSVLLSARYDKNEVDTAIMVLRENIKTNKTRVDGLHKIFRTDQALQPEEISQLLGIEVDIKEKVVSQSRDSLPAGFQYVLVWLFSVALAVSSIMLYMYFHKVGVFYTYVQ